MKNPVLSNRHLVVVGGPLQVAVGQKQTKTIKNQSSFVVTEGPLQVANDEGKSSFCGSIMLSLSESLGRLRNIIIYND